MFAWGNHGTGSVIDVWVLTHEGGRMEEETEHSVREGEKMGCVLRAICR